MGKTYIFRLDDISWDMNYENFSRIRDLFFRYDVRPLIGVIPNNKDLTLKAQVGKRHLSEDEFWKEVYSLQREYGWAVALHGYNHVYVTDNGGIFGNHPYAEFAGLLYEHQEEKIQKGKAILEQHGLTIDAFMAPGHSLDWNTVKALKNNGIYTITDGIAAYPYRKRDMLFVPQVWSWPRKGILGIETVCFHINSWDSRRFERLESFFQKNQGNCSTFQDVVRQANENDSPWKHFANGFSKLLILVERKVKYIYRIAIEEKFTWDENPCIRAKNNNRKKVRDDERFF